MARYFDLRKNFLDLSSLVDDKRRPLDAHILPAVHRLFLPDAVGGNDRLVRVGDEWERKFEFRPEFLVTLFRIGTDAEHDSVPAFNPCEMISKIAGLFRAAGRIVFRIKIENNFFTTKFFESNLAASVVLG